MQTYIHDELINIAPKFKRACWRKRKVNRLYKTAAEAWRYHKRENCSYEQANGRGYYRFYDNAKIDMYGTRYN